MKAQIVVEELICSVPKHRSRGAARGSDNPRSWPERGFSVALGQTPTARPVVDCSKVIAEHGIDDCHGPHHRMRSTPTIADSVQEVPKDDQAGRFAEVAGFVPVCPHWQQGRECSPSGSPSTMEKLLSGNGLREQSVKRPAYRPGPRSGNCYGPGPRPGWDAGGATAARCSPQGCSNAGGRSMIGFRHRCRC